jgi:hypothetical protein
MMKAFQFIAGLSEQRKSPATAFPARLQLVF